MYNIVTQVCKKNSFTLSHFKSMPMCESRKSLMLSREISVTGSSPWLTLFNRYCAQKMSVSVFRRR